MYKLGIFNIVFWGIILLWGDSLSAQDEDIFQFPEAEIEEISADMMQNENKIIYIQDLWKFRVGDSLAWADPNYDDSGWDYLSTNLSQADLSFMDWSGIGWFRKQFRVDESLRGKPVALIVERHLGASEIYLNGEKVKELGEFSTDPESVASYNSNNPLAIVFSDQEFQTLAVRFINPNYSETELMMGYNGFRFLLGDWEHHQEETFSFISQWTGRNLFYIGALLAFGVIHFLLFVFYPSEKRNLYFSIFVGFLAILSYLIYKVELLENTTGTLQFIKFIFVIEVLVLTFATRFTHSIDKKITPFYSNFLVAAGIIVSLLIWYYPMQTVWLRELAILVFVAEILRTVIVMFYRNRGGVWLLGVGVLVYVFSLIYNVMVNFEILSGSVQLGNMVGSGVLVMSMSVFLSRDFAITQRRLEQKLIEVRHLSKRSLEQERINKEREIEKRLLEAENKRKTTELEEARALQLSMLPKKMPSLPGYDLAVFMETATEVGGDYYDYSVAPDGTLVLALGDATGHGMKAGIMVAAAKSYFHTLVHEMNNLTMLGRISSGLRNMNMKMMYMGLMLARCKGNEIEIATAGMPPALHFKRNTNCVDRITLKGLPLGGTVKYPYENEKFTMDTGDILLMMSDGLTELFDPKREMLGLNKIENLLCNSDGMSANDIVNQLTQLINTWSGGREPHDDITIMVLKMQN
ncbi:MAG: SpoIIE family protein phosphatase [Balneolaceae bacterium]|nr:SpoIIE family protein phosphatase [Balneolaceae bacterium]